MANCPNCGRPTARTKDYCCQWCGYPLPSGPFRPLDKTFKELKAERMAGVASQPEPEEELEEETVEEEVEEESVEEISEEEPEPVREESPQRIVRRIRRVRPEGRRIIRKRRPAPRPEPEVEEIIEYIDEDDDYEVEEYYDDDYEDEYEDDDEDDYEEVYEDDYEEEPPAPQPRAVRRPAPEPRRIRRPEPPASEEPPRRKKVLKRRRPRPEPEPVVEEPETYIGEYEEDDDGPVLEYEEKEYTAETVYRKDIEDESEDEFDDDYEDDEYEDDDADEYDEDDDDEEYGDDEELDDEDEEDDGYSVSAPASVASVQPDMEISVDELVIAYETDPDGADMRFVDRVLRVTGRIEKVDIRRDMAVFDLLLEASEPHPLRQNVRCVFGPKNGTSIEDLAAGQTVTVQGNYDGSIINISMRDCVLI